MSAERGRDGWLVGVVVNDGNLAGLRVDAGHLAAGPASGRGVRVHVRLRFTDVTESGFPGPDESAALLEREAAIVSTLGSHATFVATVTAPGFRDLVFYTDQLDAVRAALADAAEVGNVEIDDDDDPSWAHYRALFADAVVADTDRRRIGELTRAAEVEAPQRDVVHRFAFATLAEADQAAAALREAGITVVFVASDDVDAEPPPLIEVTETETLSQVEMARSRDALHAFAASWEGTYEGWFASDADAARAPDPLD